MTEFDEKQTRIRTLLTKHNLDGLLLRRVSSFAWATCGAASYVNTAATEGVAALLVTPSNRYLITNNIEAPRFEQEAKLAEQGWVFRVGRWYESDGAVAELSRGLTLGADGPYPGAVDLSGEMARVRAALTSEEGERFRSLGRLCAEAVHDAVRAVHPGQTEHHIAGLLARAAERRGVQVVVNLIAADKRICNYRHPLPTAKKLDRYAMLVLCGRRHGLICSITRFVHFGRVPDELRRKAQAVARVDAAFIDATRPGYSLGQIFQRAVAVYAQVGFPDEWHRHHQGGLAGYEPREVTATPDTPDVVSLGQVFAWNPSITGTKSEDTILLTENGHDVLTAIPDWPTVTVHVDGKTLERPAILEVT